MTKCPGIFALIPAYNPDAQIVSIIEELIASQIFERIIVVDDGSRKDKAEILEKIEANSQVSLLKHAINLGKGAALKTGLNFIAANYPDSCGAVTLDADGQHLANDVIKIAKALKENPNKLIMGCRQFDADVPFRSRFGNIATREILKIIGGIKVSDTQTGLRGIPLGFIPSLLKIKAQGYDFEMDMLMLTKSNRIQLLEVPINTIYIDNNKSSNFNPFLDSLRIYIVFVRFNISSLIAAAVDYTIFALVFMAWDNLVLAIAVARLIAGTVNFLINKKLVFKSDGNMLYSAFAYVSLVLILGVMAYSGVYLLSNYLNVNVYLAKVITELILYVISFVVQRNFVFITKDNELLS